ncbi:ING family protein [Salix suchowensis]|nr:ING family protein [Salix suchowensis]
MLIYQNYFKVLKNIFFLKSITAHVQLWLEKLGAKEPFSGSVAICRTIAREEEALGRYKLTAGNIVLFPKFKVHGEICRGFTLEAEPSLVFIVYIPRARGLMEILDKDWMDFYVWTPDGSSLFALYQDEAYWML